MGKVLIAVLVALLLVISSVPFVELGTKIQWTTYLGIPLVILTGSAGVAFICRRFEVVIVGMILSALWPVLIDAAKSILTTL